MNRTPIPVIDIDEKGPLQRGHAMGEPSRKEIHEIANIRLDLMAIEGKQGNAKDILNLAQRHLPILLNFDKDLFTELEGISQAAEISLERLIVLNHYTDLRDISPGASKKDTYGDQGCSTIYVPDSEDGPILGQTWDVHGSATPFVCLYRIKEQGQKIAVFSLLGCQGMTGLSSHGLGITINNFPSNDAKIGISWPALVRKALREKNAADASKVILDAPLGSGHYYFLADGHSCFGISTSGEKRKITHQENKLHFHTNHSLDEEIRSTHGTRKGSTTYKRYETLENMLQNGPVNNMSDMFTSFSKVSAQETPMQRNTTATCGAIVMNLVNKKLLVSQGAPTGDIEHDQPSLVAL